MRDRVATYALLGVLTFGAAGVAAWTAEEMTGRRAADRAAAAERRADRAQVRALAASQDALAARLRALGETPPPTVPVEPADRRAPAPDVAALVRVEVAGQVASFFGGHPELRGDPGRSPTAAELVDAVTDAIASRPDLRGRDGASVTVEQVAPLVSAEVARALAANPPAGVDPAAVRSAAAEWLLGNVDPIVRATVEAWLAAHPPPPGPAGAPAPPVTDEQLAGIVAAYILANPPPPGPPGRDAPPPTDAQVAAAVAAQVSAWLDANLGPVVDARLAAGEWLCDPPRGNQRVRCIFTPAGR